jgi:tetratricopeptide (TPR) repeat protein
VGTLLLGACASQQTTNPEPPLLRNTGPEIQVADIDVLAVSPEMNEFLERYILPYSRKHTRAILLMDAVTPPNGALGFDYDDTLTLTASEAFERRTGNCIGFANMMIALARKAGLEAEYQEITRRPEWSSRKDTVLIIKHVNVILSSPDQAWVVDVSGLRLSQELARQITDDNYAKALYLNNLGAEALLNYNLPTAHAYLSKAIETEPRMSDPWINMGVVFGRNDQLEDAKFAFKRALQIDGSSSSAMSNLYEVYVAQEDYVAALDLQKKVEKYRRDNPYYLLKLSDEALAQEEFEESINLLQRAIRKKDNDHMLYFALAKTQYLSGEVESAEDNLVRARKVAPRNMMAHYGRPLDELVAEEEMPFN